MYMQTQTFNISMPQELVQEIDKVAAREYRNRSELIREAVKQYVEKKSRWEKVFAMGKKVAKNRKLTPRVVDQMVYDFRHNGDQS